jgi:hypothetical protein
MSSPTDGWFESDGSDLAWVERLWEGTCSPDELPSWGIDIAALIASARGPVTAEEHAAEPFVVARMQHAIRRDSADGLVAGRRDANGIGESCAAGDDVARFVVRRHRPARAAYRAAVAKVAVVVGVVALGAATATGGPSAFASYVEGWIDNLLSSPDPAPSVGAPGSDADQGDPGRGTLGRSSTASSGRPGEDRPAPASQGDGRTDRQGPDAVPPAHGGVAPGQELSPGQAESPASGRGEDPPGASGSAGHSGTSPPGHDVGSPGGTGAASAHSDRPDRSGNAPAHGGSTAGQEGDQSTTSGSPPAEGASGHGGSAPRLSESDRLVDVSILGVVALSAVPLSAG